MVLTKAGSILGPIATVLGYVMDILFRFTSSFGVFNVGLCIILFTIVMKTLMIPLTIKQQKTTKLMSVMNPEIQAIQKKYKGKSDQESMQRQNVEIQAVYEKYGTSMTGGCLPLLIQMPILLALYRVIYNIPAYVPSVRVYFDNVVTPLMGQADYAQKLQEITNIATACGGKLDKFDFTNANRLVDMLYKFSTAQWGELQALFPAISDVIGQNAAVVERMNTFLGLNMAEAPGWVPSFAWIIPVLAAVSQWFSTKLMSGNQPSTSADAENPMAQSMKTMTTTMPDSCHLYTKTYLSSVGDVRVVVDEMVEDDQLPDNSLVITYPKMLHVVQDEDKLDLQMDDYEMSKNLQTIFNTFKSKRYDEYCAKNGEIHVSIRYGKSLKDKITFVDDYY